MSTKSEAKPDAKGAPPVFRERIQGVEAAVWENAIGSEGKTRLRLSLSKSYKDKDGNWASTTNLDIEDAPIAQLVLSRAWEWSLRELQRRARERASA